MRRLLTTVWAIHLMNDFLLRRSKNGGILTSPPIVWVSDGLTRFDRPRSAEGTVTCHDIGDLWFHHNWDQIERFVRLVSEFTLPSVQTLREFSPSFLHLRHPQKFYSEQNTESNLLTKDWHIGRVFSPFPLPGLQTQMKHSDWLSQMVCFPIWYFPDLFVLPIQGYPRNVSSAHVHVPILHHIEFWTTPGFPSLASLVNGPVFNVRKLLASCYAPSYGLQPSC